MLLSFWKCSNPLSKNTENEVPLFCSLLTVIFAWCLSATSFTIDSPIPVLGLLLSLLNDAKRTNSLFCTSRVIPVPSSFTCNSIKSSFFEGRMLTSIRRPSGVYLKALDSRLNKSFSKLSRSIQSNSLPASLLIIRSMCLSLDISVKPLQISST